MLNRDLLFTIAQKADVSTLYALSALSLIIKANTVDTENFWQQRCFSRMKNATAIKLALPYYGSYRELYRAIHIGYIFVYYPKILSPGANFPNKIADRFMEDVSKIYDNDDLTTFRYYLSLRGYTMEQILQLNATRFIFDDITNRLREIKSYNILSYIISEYRKMKNAGHKFPQYFYDSIANTFSSLVWRYIENDNIIKFLALYYDMVDNDDNVFVSISHKNILDELVEQQINAPLFRFLRDKFPETVKERYLQTTRELQYIQNNMLQK